MTESLCGECGAALEAARTCRDHFEALLGLEWRIPGGVGEKAHFYAVASYGLQHPSSMNYTTDTRDGLRRAVADMLAGALTMEQLRQRTRADVRETGRVTRRTGDPGAGWGISSWPMTVVDVLAMPAEPDAYRARTAAWARSIMDTLDLEPQRQE